MEILIFVWILMDFGGTPCLGTSESIMRQCLPSAASSLTGKLIITPKLLNRRSEEAARQLRELFTPASRLHGILEMSAFCICNEWIFQIAATPVAGLHAELGQEEENLVAGIASVLVDEHLNSAGRMLLLFVLPFVEADAENIRWCLHSYLKPVLVCWRHLCKNYFADLVRTGRLERGGGHPSIRQSSFATFLPGLVGGKENITCTQNWENSFWQPRW